ncbi:VIT family protein [Sphingomonas sp. So64.6b]|uniref:VIT1/CCC1 transporter family protein n=1 Tax=Sphingomonas sp. So64.6b TaxID=2997354 RepID=UPI001600C207|nr:VIT family protein [Sphingomonas sp. So64.6b]QNA84636.1 VIT family protein [Sphingomonas sp. So64.6b]
MRSHREGHLVKNIGWLRAAVLGANDGIVSTASLIVGVAAAQTSQSSILLTGVAGLVAGAMSMAAGEYVSVSSQSDTENADRAREQSELTEEPEAERRELAAIYRHRGLDAALALQVADQLMAKDALGAHVRDELGITDDLAARPVQAALASAASFAAGAILPVLMVLLFSGDALIEAVVAASLVLLAALGAVGARVGGANQWRGAFRVTFWGALAMAATAGIGALFGANV